MLRTCPVTNIKSYHTYLSISNGMFLINYIHYAVTGTTYIGVSVSYLPAAVSHRSVLTYIYKAYRQRIPLTSFTLCKTLIINRPHSVAIGSVALNRKNLFVPCVCQEIFMFFPVKPCEWSFYVFFFGTLGIYMYILGMR